MAVLDYTAKEVRFRFAIAGVPGAGKATLLSRIHAALPPVRREDIYVRAIGSDQIAGFDFSPPNLFPIAGHLVHATIATVPGRASDPAVWSRVFNDIDALLFVADSRPARIEENLAAVAEVAARRQLADVPVVFFPSKTDLSGAMPVADLIRRINPIGAPYTTDPGAALNALINAGYAAA